MSHMQFSWSDSLNAAFSSCLPCLRPAVALDDSASDSEQQQSHAQRARGPFAHAVPPPRARPDELEGLLADVDAADDADALSLHTNPGDRRRGKKAKAKAKRRRGGGPKHIRVFGFDLFGRPPAIQLPESDDEEPPAGGRRRARGLNGSGNGVAGASGGPGAEDEGWDGPDAPRVRTISTSTLDSDAAPLDVSAIEARAAEAAAREAEERAAKEERRRRRRERREQRELKRQAVARALDAQAGGGVDFEGFQGSGPVLSGAPLSPFAPSLTSGTGSGTGTGSVSGGSDGFGPFAQGRPTELFDPDAAPPPDDDADFGAESYTARPRKSGAPPGSSDARSSSAGTGTNSRGYAGAGYLAQVQHAHAPALHSPLSPYGESPFGDAPLGSPTVPSVDGEKRKKKRRKSRPAALSVSGSSASASTGGGAALVSPPMASSLVGVLSPREDFEGFPGEFGAQELAGGVEMDGAGEVPGMVPPVEAEEEGGYTPVVGFPSTGLRGFERRKSDAGVFLARRGDE